MQRLDNVSLKSKLFNNSSWVLKILIGLVLGILWIGFSQFIVVKADTELPTDGSISQELPADSNTTVDNTSMNFAIIQTDENGEMLGKEIKFSEPANNPSEAELNLDTKLKGVLANRPLIPSSGFEDPDETYFAPDVPNAIKAAINTSVIKSYDTPSGFNNGIIFVKNYIKVMARDGFISPKYSGPTNVFHLVYGSPYKPMQFEITQVDAKGNPIVGNTNFSLEVGSSIDDANSKLSESLKNVSDKPVALSDTDKVNSYYDVLDTAGKTTQVPLTKEALDGYKTEEVSYSDTGKSIVTAIIQDLVTKGITDKNAGQVENIHLVYKADTNSSSGGNSSNAGSHGSSNSSHSGGSTVDREVEGIEERISTYHDFSDVKLYDDNGSELTDCKLAPNSDWFTDESMTLNGVKYYRVATNQWAKAKDIYLYYDNVNNVRVNEGSIAGLVKDSGKDVTDRALQAGSSWYTDRYIYINNVKYYRVATNEFVSSNNVQEY